MLVIWLPRWKCSSLRQSAMPRAFSSSSARSDLGDRQAELRAVAARRLPAARAAAGQLDAHADLRAARRPARAYFRISSSSVYFSTTGMICRPIFWASIAISMNSSSLKPLQMIGVSLSAMRHHRQQLGLAAGLEAEADTAGRSSRTSSTTCRCWFTLIG